jgi:diguanylate cyclase (GGDEF)-like protein
VILPNTPWPGAETVGQRISATVTSLPVPNGDAADGARVTGERVRETIAHAALPLIEDGHPAHVTVSVGAATLPAHAVDADELVSKADQALYRAKQLGKDRVEVYLPE